MTTTPQAWPEWYDGRHINEVLFCQQFLDKHPMKCVRGRLFTVDGLIEDEGQIGNLILEEISGVCLILILKKRAMRRMSLFVCLCFLLPIYAWSVSDNKAKQISDINFENGTVSEDVYKRQGWNNPFDTGRFRVG